MKTLTKETHLGHATFYNKSGDAPNLTSIESFAWFEDWKGQAPNLTSIGGVASFEGWQGQAPNLSHVGEEYRDNNWSRLKKICKQCKNN